MMFFTICSRNFLGYANTLYASLHKAHPGALFSVVLCDAIDDLDIASLPYSIVQLDQLGIPNLAEMAHRYNITELNTACKPYAFLHYMELGHFEVVYLDPDIWVVSPLDELISLVTDESTDCVLTPHITQPAPFAEVGDNSFIKYGIYNLGFCAFRDNPRARQALQWWADKLEDQCTIDLENGVFVDQKWADYFPAFLEGARILRHQGYNVAYWNLAERPLSLIDGVWHANNAPLRFFHFSGNNIENPAIFTRHSKQFTPQNTPALRVLLEEYRIEVFRNGHRYFKQFPYSFSWLGASGKNEHTPAPNPSTQTFDNVPHLAMLRSSSKDEFDIHQHFNGAAIKARKEIENQSIPTGNKPFCLHGYCSICASPQTFQVSQMYSSTSLPDGRIIPNWREHLNCLGCGSVNRLRAAYNILKSAFDVPPDADIYITEQVTPAYELFKKLFPKTVGSEYLGSELSGGAIRNGIRHEDIQALSFSDRSFDWILSFDVLEHVPFPKNAFLEMFRCLRKGGRLFFTAPLDHTSRQEQVRARMLDDGTIEHLLEPEYHGNPVDMENGALCFRYFGWSVLDELRNVGFMEAEIISVWSEPLLHFGDGLLYITARKP